MKRQGWIAGLLLAATLTGCGAEEAEMVLKQPEEPARTEKAEQGEKADPAPTRLLLSEEALAYMYQDGRANGFDFGGVEEDGAFFYEFTRPEESDFCLRISEDEETAIVHYHGETMALNDRTAPNGSLLEWHISAGYGGAVSGYGMPFWVDMTGDGQPDLLWLQGGGGTGAHTDWCVAYDMAAMKEIPIVEPWEEMAAFISVEPLEWQKGKYGDGNIVCQVTDGDGGTYTGYLWAPEETWREYVYHPGKSGYTGISIDEENHTLQIYMAFGLEAPHVYGAYMGELTAELAYDAEQGAIVRTTPIAVTVYAPDKM